VNKQKKTLHPIIAEHWNKRELPGFNCITYPNGTVTILDCYSLQNSQTMYHELFCRPLCDTAIESMEKYDAADWTFVDEWTRIAYNGGNIIAGDGTMGNMGFIAYIDNVESLIWGVFFTNSNPIKQLSICEGILSAVNEHSDLRIEINIEKPFEIKKTIL
jgi:hypothetical protein